MDRPAKYPASEFPVWSYPSILYYNVHEHMHSVPIKMMVLPSEAVAVLGESGTCFHADWCLYNAYSGTKYYLYHTQKLGRVSSHALPAISKERIQGRLTGHAWRALEWTTILWAATLVSPNIFALDEITRGIRHAFKTWTIPIWVSFGVQVLLDIQDVFTTSIEKPLKDLQAHVQYASKMLAKDLDFDRPFEAKGYERAHVDRATSILRDIRNWTLTDMVGAMLRQEHSMDEHPVLGPVLDQDNYVLRNHPLRCGMLKYYLYLQVHSTGAGVES